MAKGASKSAMSKRIDAAVAEGADRSTATEEFVLPVINIRRCQVTIEGENLIVHRFSEKSRRQMADKQQGAARGVRKPKVPKDDFEGAQYRTLDGRHGFPASAIKQACVNSASKCGLTKVLVKGAMFVQGDILPLTCSEPVMREDTVRLETGVADLRYRPQYERWSMTFIVKYDADLLNPKQIATLLQRAGFSVGLGERRPQREGAEFGLFTVTNMVLNVQAAA